MAYLGFFSLFGLVVSIALALSPKDKKTVLLICVLGWLFALVKVWLIQQTPQWLDVNSDSHQYLLHAQALAAHWHGDIVNIDQYRLNNMLGDVQGHRFWLPGDTYPYAYVLGTHEWAYSAYLAAWSFVGEHWEMWAIYSNTVFAAFFPVAAYGITKNLTVSKKIPVVAVIFILIDPSIAVNASWILKDTLAAFFVLGAVWALVLSFKSPNARYVLIAIIFTACLARWRFIAFIAVLCAVVIVAIVMIYMRQWPKVVTVFLGIFCCLTLSSMLYYFPQNTSVSGVVNALVQPLGGQTNTLQAKESEWGADDAVLKWKKELSANPVKAVTLSIGKSMIAPFHINVFRTGQWGHNKIELYVIGAIWWVILLPGTLWGVVILLRNVTFPSLFLLSMLGLLLVAYTVFYGEWSTRQRVFMLPVLFCLSAIGWADLQSRVARCLSVFSGKRNHHLDS